MNDLENMRVEDARAWYQRWYAPNNATLVVVGDVKHEEVFKLAQHISARSSRIRCPLRKPQKEPLQRGIKRVTGKSAGQAALPGDGLPRAGTARRQPGIGSPMRWKCWRAYWTAMPRRG